MSISDLSFGWLWWRDEGAAEDEQGQRCKLRSPQSKALAKYDVADVLRGEICE
jgi:hypothetical protein